MQSWKVAKLKSSKSHKKNKVENDQSLKWLRVAKKVKFKMLMNL